MKSLLLLMAFATPMVSWASDAGATEYEIRAMQRAHAAVDEVRQNFKESLAKGNCHIGPTKAGSMKVGRTSKKIRNPANTPPQWVEPYLEKFTNAKPSEVPKSVLVPLQKGQMGYLEPIFIEPLCLKCHGQNLSAGVREDLKKYYPKDAAVNYRLGDLRGLLWLEWEAEKGSK